MNSPYSVYNYQTRGVIACLVKVDVVNMSLVKVFIDNGLDTFQSIDNLFVEEWMFPGYPQGSVINTSIGRTSVSIMLDSGIPLANSFTIFFVNQALPLDDHGHEGWTVLEGICSCPQKYRIVRDSQGCWNRRFDNHPGFVDKVSQKMRPFVKCY